MSKEFRRKPAGGKRPPKGSPPEAPPPEDLEEDLKEKPASGKVVDILV